jgi:virginiamycin B lyase
VLQLLRPVSGARWRLCGLRFGLALAITVLSLALPSSPASASAPVVAALGVRCSLNGQITFSPPLRASNGANVSRIKAALTGCTTQSAEIQSGSLIGSFRNRPFDCATRSATDPPLNGTITWGPNGNLRRLEKTKIIDGDSTGSFAGVASMSLNVPSTLAAMCAGRRGVKKILFTATLEIGPACGKVGDPTSIYAIARVCDTSSFKPTDITVGSDGALWFVNARSDSFGRITTSGAVTLYPETRPGVAPLVAGPDGALWFASDGPRGGDPCVGNFAIGRVTTAGVQSFFTNLSIADVGNLIVGPDGALWFPNGGCNGVPYSIGRITTSGSVAIYTGPGINNPVDLTVGPDGAIWFVNEGNFVPATDSYTDPSIGRITTSGAVSSFSAPSLQRPGSLTAGPDGALWFNNYGEWNYNASPPVVVGSSIGRITTSGAIASYTGSGVYGPSYMTAGPDGALWFINSVTACFKGGTPEAICPDYGSVGRITTSGVITHYTPRAGNFGALFEDIPTGLIFGPDGALWFTTEGGFVTRMTTTGTFSYYQDYPGILDPGAVVVGPDNAIWFPDFSSDAIGRITPP